MTELTNELLAQAAQQQVVSVVGQVVLQPTTIDIAEDENGGRALIITPTATGLSLVVPLGAMAEEIGQALLAPRVVVPGMGGPPAGPPIGGL